VNQHLNKDGHALGCLWKGGDCCFCLKRNAALWWKS